MIGKLNQNIKAIFVENLCNECIGLFVLAYELAFIDKFYSNQWEEDTFTAHLCERYLENLQIESRWIINPQVPKYSDEISLGNISALTAPKPDIKFQKFVFDGEKPFTFYIEAKNLSEYSWQKESGSNVDASKQRSRYIKTGIDHFKNENYPLGCLAGYVVQGNINQIVSIINKRLTEWNRESEILIEANLIKAIHCGFKSIHFISSGKKMELKHVFLQFS